MKALHWRIIPLVVFGSLVILLWRGLSLDPQHLPSAKLGKPLPEFSLPILGHNKLQLTPSILNGEVSLLNVWASWCETCSEEQVFLTQLAQQGVAIYGLNYKDSPHDAREWLTEWGNPYKLVGEDLDGKVSIDLGVYGAPETFLVDKKGRIRYRHVGVLNRDIWRKEFLPRIKQLERVG